MSSWENHKAIFALPIKDFKMCHSRRVLLSLIVVFCISGCHHTQPLTSEVPLGRIDQEVAAAKSASKTSVFIYPPTIQSPSVPDVDTALRYFAVFTGVPIQYVVAIDSSRDSIYTWYKFSIDEDISKKENFDEISQPPAAMKVPLALLPLQKKEVLVKSIGGTLLIDGVTVDYGHREPTMQLNQTYLVFLSPIITQSQEHTRVFMTFLGNGTIFALNPDDDTIVPVQADSKARSGIQMDLHNRFHNSLSRLRSLEYGHAK